MLTMIAFPLFSIKLFFDKVKNHNKGSCGKIYDQIDNTNITGERKLVLQLIQSD